MAPFDEELTLVFRGPMELSNLAVYYPGGPSSAWTRESYWTPDTTSNLVWFNNRGGGESGVFTICTHFYFTLCQPCLQMHVGGQCLLSLFPQLLGQ